MVRRAGKVLKKRVERLFGAAKKRIAARKAAKALERMDPIARQFAEIPTPKGQARSPFGQVTPEPTAAEVAAVAQLERVAYAAGRSMVTIPRETRNLNL